MLGEAFSEFDVSVVGVAVDRVGRRRDRGPHAGQWAVDGFVAGDLDGARHRPAWRIGRQIGQLGAQTGGHAISLGVGRKLLCLPLAWLCTLLPRRFWGLVSPPVPSGSVRRRARAAEWDSLLMSCPS